MAGRKKTCLKKVPFKRINPETQEILSIEERVPEEGISCQSAACIFMLSSNKDEVRF